MQLQLVLGLCHPAAGALLDTPGRHRQQMAAALLHSWGQQLLRLLLGVLPRHCSALRLALLLLLLVEAARPACCCCYWRQTAS